MRHAIIPALLLAWLLAGCTHPADPVHHERFYALGTLVDLSLYGATPEQQAQASVALTGLFTSLHGDWHAWENGKLAQINARLATGTQVTPEPEMLQLLLSANRLSQESDGLFNPVIGKLVRLWGFHADEITALAPPEPAAVRTLLAQAPSAGDVSLDNGRLVSRNPAVQYDLGAFAKGYAVDRGIELLRSLGIGNAIINAGGDLRAIGRRGDRAWRIGIRHPRKPGVLASVDMAEDESIFTSGDYERYFVADGRRYHHIIDPRTGYPATSATSVTVIHHDAATADAAATALFVAGAGEWTGVARRMGIRYVMLIDPDGVVHMNPAMQLRIHFEDSPPPPVRISEPLT